MSKLLDRNLRSKRSLVLDKSGRGLNLSPSRYVGQVKRNNLLKVAVSLYSFCSARFLNRWSVDEHGILEIRQLQLKDFGVFQCVAKNLVSEGDRRTYLVVTGKHRRCCPVNSAEKLQQNKY